MFNSGQSAAEPITGARPSGRPGAPTRPSSRFFPCAEGAASPGGSRAEPRRAMRPRALLFLLLLLAGPVRPNVGLPSLEAAVPGLWAQLASGELALPRAALEPLLNIAAARAHCPPAPCGKCLSALDILALVGKPAAGDANLTASELPPFFAGVLFYLTDPTAACAAVKNGHWVAKAGAFLASFSEGNPAAGPSEERVAALLGALRKNYRDAELGQACMDARRILHDSADVSPRVTPDPGRRVLVTVAYRALRGDCFRALPPESYFVEYILHRYGNETHNLTLAGESDGRRGRGRGAL
uniref:Zinc transporter ZIP4 N-terminal domain-containing protein n=1 Tax=Sphenodon punctatus TaxID=8508 RepID=A0A8D0HEG7_SPHPU